MHRIVISNRKGGSGKSTTAVNLSAFLSKKYRVLLIDFDTQGHSTIGVGAQPFEEGGAHTLFCNTPLSHSFLPTVSENLTVAAASLFFDPYESTISHNMLYESIKRESLSSFFDFCIIDTPPTFDAILKNSLYRASGVVIPLVPHPLGIIGSKQMFRAIFKSTLDAPLKFIGILPTMFNSHIKEHLEILEEAYETFGKDKVFEPIQNDISLSKQFYTKMPVVLDSKRSRGAKEYMLFGEEIIRRLG